MCLLSFMLSEQAVIDDSLDFGIWEIKYFFDEYGDPSDEPYITNTKYFNGTFSNSATTNDTLSVSFIITKKDVYMKLYEYGSNLVKNIGCDIGLKHNGKEIYDVDSNWKQMIGKNFGDRQQIKSFGRGEKISSLLKEGGEFKFYIKCGNEYSMSYYKFKIKDANGFENIYKHLFKSK